jgi:hypothetical protein
MGDPFLIRRELTGSDEHRAYWRSVETCGKRHLCPKCRGRILQRDAERLEEAVTLWHRKGGGTVTFCQTVHHSADDSFVGALDRLQDVAKALGKLTRWRKFKRRWGLRALCWGLDITHSDVAGWHPHRHGVFFTLKELQPEEIARFNREYFACWQVAAAHVDGAFVVADANYCERLFSGPAVAQYVFKAAMETHRHDLKEAKAGQGRTPFQILADLATEPTQDDYDLWVEYEHGIHNRRGKYFTAGFLDEIGVGDETDDEAARAEEDGVDVEGATLEAETYLRAKSSGALPAIRAAMETGGFSLARRTLSALGYPPGALLRMPDGVLETVGNGSPRTEKPPNE